MNLRKILSHVLSFLFAIALIGGCITPAYYSHKQEISLTIPEGATAEMDGKPLEQRGNTVQTTVNRSWRNKEITVKKEGYKDEKVKLKSVATKDQWADTFGDKESGANLLIPIHTAIPAAAVVGSPIIAVAGVANHDSDMIATAPAIGAAGLLALPFGIAMDLFNIFIGAPSTAIINPWREYEYNENVTKMEPLKKNNLSEGNH